MYLCRVNCMYCSMQTAVGTSSFVSITCSANDCMIFAELPTLGSVKPVEVWSPRVSGFHYHHSLCLRIALVSDWRNMLWNVFAIVVSTLISHAKRSYRHSNNQFDWCDLLGRRCGCRSSFVAMLSFSLFRWFLLLFTVGDGAFPVTAARVWNSLPDLVTSAPSVAVFRSRLKTHLFNISYPCDCTVPAQWL